MLLFPLNKAHKQHVILCAWICGRICSRMSSCRKSVNIDHEINTLSSIRYGVIATIYRLLKQVVILVILRSDRVPELILVKDELYKSVLLTCYHLRYSVTAIIHRFHKFRIEFQAPMRPGFDSRYRNGCRALSFGRPIRSTMCFPASYFCKAPIVNRFHRSTVRGDPGSTPGTGTIIR
jgi:hypothetical protein